MNTHPSKNKPAQFCDNLRSDRLHVSGFPIVLSVASYYALMIDCPEIALAATKEQMENNPGLIRAFEKLTEAVEGVNPNIPRLKITAPFSKLTKSQIVELGASLGVPMEHSWTCCRGGVHQCGKCATCRQRKAAFKKGKVTDKTIYETVA